MDPTPVPRIISIWMRRCSLALHVSVGLNRVPEYSYVLPVFLFPLINLLHISSFF